MSNNSDQNLRLKNAIPVYGFFEYICRDIEFPVTGCVAIDVHLVPQKFRSNVTKLLMYNAVGIPIAAQGLLALLG